MAYIYNYPKIRQGIYNCAAKVRTYAKQKFQPVKDRMQPYIEPSMKELAETKHYYFGNARDGWIRGRRLAKIQKRNVVTSFFYKSGLALTQTKIRTKDIIPIIAGAIFSFTNPFFGLGILGFALGQKFNKQIIDSLQYIPKVLQKIKIK